MMAHACAVPHVQGATAAVGTEPWSSTVPVVSQRSPRVNTSAASGHRHADGDMEDEHIHVAVRLHLLEVVAVPAVVDDAVPRSGATVDLVHKHVVALAGLFAVVVAEVDLHADLSEPILAGTGDDRAPRFVPAQDRLASRHHGCDQGRDLVVAVFMGAQHEVECRNQVDGTAQVQVDAETRIRCLEADSRAVSACRGDPRCGAGSQGGPQPDRSPVDLRAWFGRCRRPHRVQGAPPFHNDA